MIAPKVYAIGNFGLIELAQKHIDLLTANKTQLAGHCKCHGACGDFVGYFEETE